MARDCQGAYVRLRYTVPEEERQSVDRGHLETLFDGAASVKIEVQVIPKVRSRAAGISRVESLPEKVSRWGETAGVAIPDNVLALAANIEGRDAEELLEAAMSSVSGVAPVAPVPVDMYQDDLFSVAA
jgi:exonuclease SbcD